MGRYPQTAEGTDQTPIEWIVLDVQDGKALLISKYGLDAKSYNNSDKKTIWEHCDLRFWLNCEFYDSAFSLEEQAVIQTTEVDNSPEQGYSGWNTNSGNNTQDQVFLLSYAEANQFFGVLWEDNVRARVEPTAYAISKRAYTNINYKTENGSAAGWWWLRSPGDTLRAAACVLWFGSQNCLPVSREDGCVRPALWLDLESEIFKSENPQYY